MGYMESVIPGAAVPLRATLRPGYLLPVPPGPFSSAHSARRASSLAPCAATLPSVGAPCAALKSAESPGYLAPEFGTTLSYPIREGARRAGEGVPFRYALTGLTTKQSWLGGSGSLNDDACARSPGVYRSACGRTCRGCCEQRLRSVEASVNGEDRPLHIHDPSKCIGGDSRRICYMLRRDPYGVCSRCPVLHTVGSRMSKYEHSVPHLSELPRRASL
jgi:hypothetical protein